MQADNPVTVEQKNNGNYMVDCFSNVDELAKLKRRFPDGNIPINPECGGSTKYEPVPSTFNRAECIGYLSRYSAWSREQLEAMNNKTLVKVLDELSEASKRESMKWHEMRNAATDDWCQGCFKIRGNWLGGKCEHCVKLGVNPADEAQTAYLKSIRSGSIIECSVLPMEIRKQYQPLQSSIKCGSLEVELNGGSFGTIKIDGKPIDVTELTFTAKAGELPVVSFTMYCDKGDGR